MSRANVGLSPEAVDKIIEQGTGKLMVGLVVDADSAKEMLRTGAITNTDAQALLTMCHQQGSYAALTAQIHKADAGAFGLATPDPAMLPLLITQVYNRMSEEGTDNSLWMVTLKDQKLHTVAQQTLAQLEQTAGEA